MSTAARNVADPENPRARISRVFAFRLPSNGVRQLVTSWGTSQMRAQIRADVAGVGKPPAPSRKSEQDYRQSSGCMSPA